jgi:hypothetical protein
MNLQFGTQVRSSINLIGGLGGTHESGIRKTGKRSLPGERATRDRFVDIPGLIRVLVVGRVKVSTVNRKT